MFQIKEVALKTTKNVSNKKKSIFPSSHCYVTYYLAKASLNNHESVLVFRW
jgi:hypothetical protein